MPLALGVNGKNASLQRGRIAVGYKRCLPLRKRTSFSKRLDNKPQII